MYITREMKGRIAEVLRNRAREGRAIYPMAFAAAAAAAAVARRLFRALCCCGSME
jgi:hypothetical protein